MGSPYREPLSRWLSAAASDRMNRKVTITAPTISTAISRLDITTP